jgi:hypothetical protein
MIPHGPLQLTQRPILSEPDRRPVHVGGTVFEVEAKTLLGISLRMIAPTGQYSSTELIKLAEVESKRPVIFTVTEGIDGGYGVRSNES